MDLSPAHVRAARALLQLTQGELSKLCGVSAKTIRKFELGKVRATEDTILRLRAAFEARRIRFLNGGSPGVRLVAFANEGEARGGPIDPAD